jgi:hypothetical protein
VWNILHTRGIYWNFSEGLEDLDFSDDLCLLSGNFREMNQKVKGFIKIAKGGGLKISSQKCKIMRINGKTTERVEIGEPVEELDEFCYHGSVVTKDGGAETDVNRINKAKGSFALLRPLWRSKEFSRNTKLRIFNTDVKSFLLYGCETWKITQTVSHNL